MLRMTAALTSAALIAALSAANAAPPADNVKEVRPGMGEMSVPLEGDMADLGLSDVDNSLRFEPIQSYQDMFLRDDVVYLMRHGPTDWSKLDAKDVAPTDCDKQRVLSEQGREDMRDLGALMALNDISFGRIVVSQWCRNQQTYDELKAGYDRVDPGAFGDIPHETWNEANLLLSLQGARDVTELREMVSGWDGAVDGEGPLLIISHFTNIQELTEFSTYEGEMLVLDPDRDNRVLGYLRLKTARPDVGHFDVGSSGTGKSSGVTSGAEGAARDEY